MCGAQRFARNRIFEAFDKKHAYQLAKSVLVYTFEYTW
jgi:hypothetical protein